MIFFLHGDDTYRSRQKLRELREKFLREVDPSGSNLVHIDGRVTTASDIWGAVAAQSFLVRKRMVVVEELGGASASVRAEISALLEKIPEDVIVVFWESRSHAPRATRRMGKKSPAGVQRTDRPSSKDELFSRLRKEQYAQECAPLTFPELERWAVSYARDVGATFAPGVAQELCGIVGPNLWRMVQEIEKLAHAAGSEAVTSAHVRQLVEVALHNDIFVFVDAFGRSDHVAALRELRRFEATDVDPQYLLAMIVRQMRLLTMAADALERGVAGAKLASELGVPPFVAQKLVAQARIHSSASLRARFPRLVQLDRALKSSRAPRQALIELFCLE